MTQTSQPHDGTTTGDAGTYSDDNWTDMFRDFFNARDNSGPFIMSSAAPDLGLQVQASGPVSANVEVVAGAALVDGTYYRNTATETLAISANASGNDRIDTIVLTKDWTAQTVRLAVEAGTPAATPVPPTLTQTDGVEWQVPLADVAADNGFATIADTDITPRQNYANAADGVYLKDVLNNSGATLEPGDPVIWDTSADRAVTTTTQINDGQVAGVWVGRTANGAYGRVLVRGLGYVNIGAAITRGNGIETGASVSVARAVSAGSTRAGTLGQALETTSAAGLALCMVNVDPGMTQILHYKHEETSGTDGGSSAATTFNTRPITDEVSDLEALGALAANQITLQPGRYVFTSAQSCYRTGDSDARLQNTSDATALLYGPTVNATNSSGADAVTATCNGEFEITVAKVLEVQLWTVLAQATTGLGLDTANAADNVFCQARFERRAS